MSFFQHFLQELIDNTDNALANAAGEINVDSECLIESSRALTYLSETIANAEAARALLFTMAAQRAARADNTMRQIDMVAVDSLKEDLEEDPQALHYDFKTLRETLMATAIGEGTGHYHSAFPKVISAVPLTLARRLGPKDHFNGALQKHKTRWLFTSRQLIWPSKTFIYRPDEDFLLRHGQEIIMPEGLARYGVEDARLFIHQGLLMMSFHGSERTANGWLSHMNIASFYDDLAVAWVMKIPSPNNVPMEKNWQFFQYGLNLFCVYMPLPHVVYEVEINAKGATLVNPQEATNGTQWDAMENARGGAPPVRIGDEYYHWYHSQFRTQNNVTYTVGLYTFEACPPWNIKRVVKGNVLSLVPSKREVDIIYPCGAVLDRKEWLISCGVDDKEIVVLGMEFEAVEKLLVPVSAK